MGFVAHDLGVDLGTSNTLVYVRHKGIVINEPTIVVVDAANERRVRAVGDDETARQIIEELDEEL